MSRWSTCEARAPRRERGRGAIDHVANRALVGVPFLAVAPVLLGDLEALEGDLFALPEAAELLLLADREPELGHHHAVAQERPLEIVYLGVGAHPIRLAGETFDAFHQYPPVPRAIVEGEPAMARQMAPEAPEVGLRALLLRRRRNRDVAVHTRVEGGGDAPDRAALAGRVVALEHADDRHRLEARVARSDVQAPLPLPELLLVLVPGHRLVELERAQHVQPIDGLRRERRRLDGC